MSKKYSVKVTPYAKDQMKEVRDYIAYQLLNPDAARNLIIKIRKEIRTLCQHPERIRIVKEHPWCDRGVRKVTVNNYYIYFWIDEAHTEVHVIAVIYTGRDQENALENTPLNDEDRGKA